jgi:hypothetical protein
MNDWQQIIASAFGLQNETIGGGAQCLTLYRPCGAHIMLTCIEGGGMPTPDSWHIGVYLGEDWETGESPDAPEWELRSDESATDCARGMRAALERLSDWTRNTDSLATDYQQWCDARALPQLSADELHHEICAMIEDEKSDAARALLVTQRDAVQRFWDLWDKVQEAEDFEATIAARG